MTEKRLQISGVAGILFVVVLAVVSAAVQGRMPSYDEGGAAIAAWFTDNGSLFLAGQFISKPGFLLFFFPFLSELNRQGFGHWSTAGTRAQAGFRKPISPPRARTRPSSVPGRDLGSMLIVPSPAFGRL